MTLYTFSEGTTTNTDIFRELFPGNTDFITVHIKLKQYF